MRGGKSSNSEKNAGGNKKGDIKTRGGRTKKIGWGVEKRREE